MAEKNPLYRLYYNGDVRIDSGVVEAVDQNDHYSGNHSNLESKDASKDKVFKNKSYVKSSVERSMSVDDEGYARITTKNGANENLAAGVGFQDSQSLDDTLGKAQNEDHG